MKAFTTAQKNILKLVNLLTWHLACLQRHDQLSKLVENVFRYLSIAEIIYADYETEGEKVFAHFIKLPIVRRIYLEMLFTHPPNNYPLVMDLSPFRQNSENNRNRQKYHHSLNKHPTFTKIAKFRCEML